MTEQVRRKLGRKKGSVTRPAEFNNIVLDYIPKDGTPIQHKDLFALCVTSGKMAYQSMRDALERLQSMGLIIKEGMKAKRGQGTCYKRVISVKPTELYQIPFDFKAFTDYLQFIAKSTSILSEKDENTQTMNAVAFLFRDFQLIITTMLYPEFQEYSKNPNKKQATERLNNILKYVINPMFMQMAEIAMTPAMSEKYEGQTRIALEHMFDFGLSNPLSDIWKAAETEHLRREKNRKGLI